MFFVTLPRLRFEQIFFKIFRHHSIVILTKSLKISVFLGIIVGWFFLSQVLSTCLPRGGNRYVVPRGLFSLYNKVWNLSVCFFVCLFVCLSAQMKIGNYFIFFFVRFCVSFFFVRLENSFVFFRKQNLAYIHFLTPTFFTLHFFFPTFFPHFLKSGL